MERHAAASHEAIHQGVGSAALEFVFEKPLQETVGYLSRIIQLGRQILRSNEQDSRNDFTSSERSLTTSFDFEESVENLSIHEIAVIPTGRKRPRSLDQFSFIPLTYRPPENPCSMQMALDHAHVPPGVRTSYPGYGNSTPFLDTSFAIGLARNNWLVALGSAGVIEKGYLKIVQLQDVSGTSRAKDAKLHYSTGLHDGFLWKDTLVAAWSAIALGLEIGDRLSIQSSDNNTWAKNSARTLPHYDEVAQRLHFTRNTPKDDWCKLLPRMALDTA
jgi:hypothetical protein